MGTRGQGAPTPPPKAPAITSRNTNGTPGQNTNGSRSAGGNGLWNSSGKK